MARKRPPMKSLNDLLTRNRAWSEKIHRDDPNFFADLSAQQAPQFFWIGCSDSRVPANQIVGMLPGELFVHRNVANVVVHSDLNCLSVLQYAVDILKVRHVMVTGHYGCGGGGPAGGRAPPGRGANCSPAAPDRAGRPHPRPPRPHPHGRVRT